ncbi:MAG TPA: sigma-70 family RNA polymerase sigma factor, partial [Gemmataceae bacterium]|nr:sigma-70 family RNA polymerase sigma factor [Gemmataceae bacterium]
MPRTPLATALQHIKQLAEPADMPQSADRDLLRIFAAHHSQDAFATLVRRHGPLVLRVCRQVTGHAQDAEDAFQATFLVLAHKAHTLHHLRSLASWLHGVAYRMALHTRRTVRRRRIYERQAVTRMTADPAVEVAW